MSSNGNPHWSYWIIGVVALLWHIGGVANFIVQMNPEALASYNAAARSIVEARPAWATAAFAVTVCAGAFGSLLLLLRRKESFYLLAISLLCSLVTMVPVFELEIGAAMLVPYALMPLAVGSFLVWYAKWAGSAGLFL